MKKQLLALTLISLGYIASMHGMGVAIMAEWGKLKKDVIENTSQIVNATAIWIEDENPTVAGQPVLEIKEKNKNVWTLNHLNPGTATLHIKKKRSGYSNNHEKAHHHCKPAVITVRAANTGKKENTKDTATENTVTDTWKIKKSSSRKENKRSKKESKHSKKESKRRKKSMANEEIKSNPDMPEEEEHHAAGHRDSEKIIVTVRDHEEEDHE